VFEHSWRLLSESERALLSALAVFRGGWTAGAAAAVLSSAQDHHAPELKLQRSELLTRLAALADKSLVRPTRLPGDPAEPRFGLLESIRKYALEQLATRGQAAALRRAHANHYLALASQAAAQWHTPAVDAWIAMLQRESDNMRAALQWARDTGDSLFELQLAGALWKFWQGYGYTSEGRAWLDKLLTLDDPQPDAATMVARLSGLQAAAWLTSDQRDDAQATRLLEQSMVLRRALRETTGHTNPLVNTARQARTEGQYARGGGA
jgi:predicted ATPase